MEIYSIETGFFKCDGGAIFGVVPKTLWERHYPSDENNLCKCAMRSIIIKNEGRIVLIDCGMGEKHSEKFFSYQYLFGDASLRKSLAALHIKPEEITDVLFTHLHFDHCGGATYRDTEGNLKLTFPNATHWVGKQQWKNYLQPNCREADAYFEDDIMPIFEAGKLHPVDREWEVMPGLSYIFAHGHTPGLLVPVIKYKKRNVIFGADFIPTSANVPVKWVAAYDTRPLISLKEKESFLEQAYEENSVLVFQHDYYTECCTLKKTKKGIEVKERFKVQDL